MHTALDYLISHSNNCIIEYSRNRCLEVHFLVYLYGAYDFLKTVHRNSVSSVPPLDIDF